MKKPVYNSFSSLAASCLLLAHSSHATSATPFEGRINATTARGGASVALLYTVGTNCLRVEMTDTNWPNAFNLVDRNSGQVTLVFPHNGTFVRLKKAGDDSSARPPGFPAMPAGLPPGIGPQRAMPISQPMPMRPQNVPPGLGPTNFPAMHAMPSMPAPPAGLPPGIGPQAQTPAATSLPAVPAQAGMGSVPGMPAMPRMPGGMELQATGEKSTLLGYPCQRFDIKQPGQTMEIWATDELPPFQPYLPSQPPGFGRPLLEEYWSKLVTARKLFPIRAILRTDNGVERYRFEVQSVVPARLTENDYKHFQPPQSYVEIQPRPF
jgi:hypothetical protein